MGYSKIRNLERRNLRDVGQFARSHVYPWPRFCGSKAGPILSYLKILSVGPSTDNTDHTSTGNVSKAIKIRAIPPLLDWNLRLNETWLCYDRHVGF